MRAAGGVASGPEPQAAVDASRAAPVVVVGIGNVLLGDDGFGPTVVGMLARQWEFPPDVELVDAGTPGLDLAGQLCGREVVVLVDAVLTDTAGLCVLTGEELLRALALRPRVSEHDPALAEALAIAALVGEAPRHVRLVGVAPVRCEVGVGLSADVEAAAREAALAIVAMLAEWGIEARARASASAPELWWAGGRTAAHPS